MIDFAIPDSELSISFARSGGPGGQNVNKVNTKVQLRWRVSTSTVFSFEQKNRIKEKLKNRINDAGEVCVDVETERSQSQNKETAIRTLHSLVAQALHISKRRRATRPTYASKKQRVESKKMRSHIKKTRKVGLE